MVMIKPKSENETLNINLQKWILARRLLFKVVAHQWLKTAEKVWQVLFKRQKTFLYFALCFYLHDQVHYAGRLWFLENIYLLIFLKAGATIGEIGLANEG